jgi:hypothetical protein
MHGRDLQSGALPTSASVFRCASWWAALVLLIANDHWLKGHRLLPPLVTGKLSDFAGLFIAPPILAVLVRSRTRFTLIACHLVIATVFAALKLSPALARAWDTLLAGAGLHSHMVPDPSDLVALVALVGSWCLLTRAPRAVPARHRCSNAWLRAGVMTGSVACIASLDASAPPFVPADTPEHFLADAFVHLGKDLSEPRVWYEPSGRKLDCSTALSNPAAYLPEFAARGRRGWPVGGGLNLPLRSDSGLAEDALDDLAPEDRTHAGPDCHLFGIRVTTEPLVGANQDTGWFVVAWSRRKLPVRAIPFRCGDDEVSSGGVIVHDEGGRLGVEVRGPIVIGR